jgi:hypothetical protein
MKLLELVARDLGAEDARIEIGGSAPDDDRSVFVAVTGSRRLVARFAEAPEDIEAKRARLEELAGAFEQSITTPLPPPPTQSVAAYRALDDELLRLADRLGARAAVVIDRSSPMLWGASHPSLVALRERDGVDSLLTIASELADEAPERSETERLKHTVAMRPELLADLVEEEQKRVAITAEAVVELRSMMARRPVGAETRWVRHHDRVSLLARSVGDVYVVGLVYRGRFGEPRADGELKRSTGYLQRLVASLPPIQPPPRGRLRLVPSL